MKFSDERSCEISQIGKYILIKSEDGITCFVPEDDVGSGQFYRIDINKLMFSSIESQLTPENLMGTVKM